MSDFNAKARRALKRARHSYALAVVRQADALTEKAERKASKALARAERINRRAVLESYRLADLAADFDGEF